MLEDCHLLRTYCVFFIANMTNRLFNQNTYNNKHVKFVQTLTNN